MPTVVKVQYKSWEGVSDSETRHSLRASMLVIGMFYHVELKMRKFRNSAHARYGIPQRGAKYNKAKLARAEAGGKRALGTIKPFVWSGMTKANAEGSKNIVATAPTSKFGKCVVTVYAPTLNLDPEIRRQFELTRPDETEEASRLGMMKYRQQQLAASGKSYRFQSGTA